MTFTRQQPAKGTVIEISDEVPDGLGEFTSILVRRFRTYQRYDGTLTCRLLDPDSEAESIAAKLTEALNK